jgi:hypothetical protein
MGFVPGTAYDLDYVVIENYPPIVLKESHVKDREFSATPPVETAREALWLVVLSSINDLMLGESSE